MHCINYSLQHTSFYGWKSGVCGVSDAKPKCAVVTSAPIRGQNVTLSCIMTYRWLSESGSLRPGATLSTSVSWESAAGTFLSNSSTDLTNNRRIIIGETLQVDMTTLASGAEIPSYDCTTYFHFTAVYDAFYTYAVNNVSWTCVSDPVLTWCMYFNYNDMCYLTYLAIGRILPLCD